MHRKIRTAVGLLAAVAVTQGASGLGLSAWGSRELGPGVSTREDFQSIAYELGAPSGPDQEWDFGRDLHYFLVVGPNAWADGTVVHARNGGSYFQSGWENWGGTCFVGLDAALVGTGFPVPVCVGSDGNAWGFWGANGQFQITVNDPQLHVRPAIASRGDFGFDVFYVHGVTCELWHTGFSQAAGWIDEPVKVGDTQLYGNPWVGGVDAAWAGFGATAPWNDKIVVAYVGLDGRPAVLTGAFAASGRAASNNINWTSNVVMSAYNPQRFPSIAFVGTPGGTAPTIFYDNGPDGCVYQQAWIEHIWVWHWYGPTPSTRIAWTGPTSPGLPNGAYYCGDVAARAAPNGSFGSKVNLWQANNYQKWGFSR